MTPQTCPDWPALMEVAPELSFRHYTLVEAQLPADALAQLPDTSFTETTICCDREHHVFHAGHTDAAVVDALRGTYWFELADWAVGPGAAA
jgi:hypothetical protein